MILLVLFGFSCEKENSDIEKEITQYNSEAIFDTIKEFKIIKGYCGSINYIGKIGIDCKTAEDSLFKTITLPNSGCPNNPCQEFHIYKDTIIVDFKFDNRTFIAIVFKDIQDKMQIMAPSEVLDERGNHYRINWCQD
jgi:hypothetical protein